MAADDAAVVVTLRANLKDYEAALKSAVRATEKAATSAEKAISNVGKSAKGGGASNVIAANFQQSAGQIEQTAKILRFQVDDALSGMMSGGGMQSIKQQLPEIAKLLGSQGGGLAMGAKTMGIALAGMINPINLGIAAFGILATVAANYFDDSEAGAKKAADAVKKLADELDRIAKAHPSSTTLQQLADDARKAADATQAATDQTTALAQVYAKIKELVTGAQVDIADFVTTLQSGNTEAQVSANNLAAAWAALQKALKDGTDATAALKAMQDALNQAQVQALPSAKAYAEAFGIIAEQFKAANEQGQKVKQTFDDVAKAAKAPLIGPPMPSSAERKVGRDEMEMAAKAREVAEKAAKEAASAAKQAAAENKREAERVAKEATQRLNEAIANQTKVAVDAVTGMLGKSEVANASEINAFLKRGGVDVDAATTAWCAAFVNSALAQVGIKGSGSNVATSFANWGKGVPLSQVQRGDVLVEQRGRGAGQTGGHVGFATGNIRAVGDSIQQVEIISGNASDKVTQEWVDASEVIARRSTDAFQLPADALQHLSDESSAATAAAKKLSADQLHAAQQLAQSYNQIAQGAVSGLVSDLMNGVDAGEAFNHMLQNIISSLAQMAIQQIFNPAGGGAGGIFGSLFGIGHGGGSVSALAAGRQRKVNPMVFANAPRFASGGMVGLKPGEVPIIAHRGEIIVPNARRLASSSGGGRVDNSIHQQNRISVDMSGSGYVAANSENAKQVGQNMQKLIQAELVRESRPGGLLRQVPR